MKESFRKVTREFKILQYLVQVRGATANQMLFAISEIPHSEIRKNKISLKNLYRVLKKMQLKKWVETMPGVKEKGKIYYLTDIGLKIIYEFYDIDKSVIGTGYQEDYGYFKADFFHPPVSTINHFSLQVDVHNIILNFKKKYPKAFDIRNNLYSSVKHTYTNNENLTLKTVFRPDLEMKILDETFYFEIDQSTERGVNLKEKFESYNRFFKHLKSQDKKTPKGIIFVSENRSTRSPTKLINLHEQRRFRSLFKYYQQECGEFTENCLLIYVTVTNLEHQIYSIARQSSDSLLKNIRETMLNSSSIQFGTNSFVNKSLTYFKVTKSSNEEKYFVLFFVNGCNSMNWLLGKRIFKETIRRYGNCKVIVVYDRLHPAIPEDKDVLFEQDESDFYTSVFFHNIHTKKWFNHQNELIQNLISEN